MSDELRRILLVEDCTRGMSPTFSQFAFSGNREIRLNLAANLTDAERRLRANGFALVLLSLRLPDSQGLATLTRFREINSTVPLAVLLQPDEPHLAEAVWQHGVVAVFTSGAVDLAAAVKIATATAALPIAVEMVEAIPDIVETDAAAREEVVEEIVEEIIPGNEAVAVSANVHAELQEQKALRHEMAGINRALEERCRELEAGQAALIEAEHVAIEREKNARLAAEMQSSQQINALRAKKNEYQRHLRDAELKIEKLNARCQKLTKDYQRACAEKKMQNEKIERLEAELRQVSRDN